MSDYSYTKRMSAHGGGGQIPRRLIVHAIAEFVQDGLQALWAPEFLEHSGLSAHYFVTPSGVVIQCRGDNQIAYHAGGHNSATIGVEFMVPGVHDYTRFVDRIKTAYLTDVQWDAGVKLCRQLRAQHNLEDVQRHSDVDPQNKVDPGEGFPWEKFLEKVQ